MGLQAGAAAVDVSPRKPVSLAGYPHVERVSTGIHDPLLASALFLRDEEAGLLLVSVDVLLIGPATAGSLRGLLAQTLSVPEAHVFVGCTHTHSGPLTREPPSWRDDPMVPAPDPEYVASLQEGIVEAAEAASNGLRPAELAWTTASAEGVGGNRHSPDGVTDPEAGVLVVRGRDRGAPFSVSIIYSMHPTVLHEDSTLVSSDFPGHARRHLTEGLGEGVTVLHHTGPSGNQSPRYHVQGQTFEEAERLGRKLGAAVLESVKRLPEDAFSADAVLGGVLGPVVLPPRKMPSVAEAEETLRRRREEFERLEAEGAGHGPVRTAECAVFGAEETVALARCQEDGELARAVEAYTPADVQCLRIGEACLVGLPGELFVEYGLEIKKRASRRTFAASLVNGDLQGYIVTPEAAAEGGYEAANCLFSHEAGPVLVEKALALISGLG